MKFKCLNCNSKKFKLFYHIKKFPTFFGAITKSQIKKINNFPLEVSYCIKCNLVQQTKPISEKYMNEVYNSKYYNCPSPLKSGMGLREIHKFWNFFNSIKQKKGKVLEIASFDGYLMSLLEKKNWDVHGCDPSAESILARKKFKNKIKTEFFRKGIYSKGEFDLIIFRNLLEHIYDINKFLRDVNFSLKKDGHIFIDVPNIKSIINTINDKKSDVAYGMPKKLLYGENFIVENLNEFEFEISADSFFQTNSMQALKMYEYIRNECKLSGLEIVYDFYCGTGTISIFIAKNAKKVYGFEIVESAIKDAKKNALTNKITNTEFYCGDLSKMLIGGQKLRETVFVRSIPSKLNMIKILKPFFATSMLVSL